MSLGLNRVFIIGNLTRDPELRYTPTGKAVCNFTVAVNRRGDMNGDQTEFLACVAWDQLGELVNQKLRKGSRALVEGHLQTNRWTNSEGEDRQRLQVVATSMLFLDGRNRDSGPPMQRRGGVHLADADMDEAEEAWEALASK